MPLADVRSDGTATIWAQAGHLQASRARLANILGTPAEKVVVHWLSHAGQFGRKTFGGDGAEADAVILSQLTGKPVRVQWTLQEDLAWSGASPAWFSDIKGGLDAERPPDSGAQRIPFAAHDGRASSGRNPRRNARGHKQGGRLPGNGMALRQD